MPRPDPVLTRAADRPAATSRWVASTVQASQLASEMFNPSPDGAGAAAAVVAAAGGAACVGSAVSAGSEVTSSVAAEVSAAAVPAVGVPAVGVTASLVGGAAGCVGAAVPEPVGTSSGTVTTRVGPVIDGRLTDGVGRTGLVSEVARVPLAQEASSIAPATTCAQPATPPISHGRPCRDRVTRRLPCPPTPRQPA